MSILDTLSTELTLAELYQITFRNGAIAYFARHNKDIVYQGKRYQAIPIKRDTIRYHSNLQVDRVSVTLGIVGLLVDVRQFTIPQVVRRDYLRNAKILITLVDYIKLDNAKTLFDGEVTGDITYNEGGLVLNCGSKLDRLNDNFPKFIFSEFCQLQLYGTYCGLNRSTYEETDTVLANTTTKYIYAAIFLFSNQAEGYWEKGEVLFSSGDNIDVSRTVVKHYDGYVKVIIPFPETVAIGDSIKAYPGCDKSGKTCDETFSNYANFMGFEYITKPENIYY
jgi:uncharacterized phage protein (TIGR02218 family)